MKQREAILFDNLQLKQQEYVQVRDEQNGGEECKQLKFVKNQALGLICKLKRHEYKTMNDSKVQELFDKSYVLANNGTQFIRTGFVEIGSPTKFKQGYRVIDFQRERGRSAYQRPEQQTIADEYKKPIINLQLQTRPLEDTVRMILNEIYDKAAVEDSL